MKSTTSRAVWGILLVGGGILALLVNLSLIPDSSWLWAGAFTLIGLYFLVVFFRSAENWWAAFPTFGALGIAATIVTSEVTALPDELAGAVFLGAISIAFILIFLRKPENWWALIPGGAILTVAAIVLVSAFENSLPENLVPVVLFGGMALTFLLISFTRHEGGRNRWAIWPAVGLAALALVTGIAVFELAGFVLPLILIGAGLVILIRRR